MKRGDFQFSGGRIALDLVLAYGAMAIFGMISFALYRPLQRGAEPHHVVVPSITAGETRSLIVSNGTCIGTVRTKLTSDDSPSLETDLSLHSKFNGESVLTTARVSTQFNPLLQLGRASASIESKHFSANISATDVTPIRITASGRIGTSIRSFDLAIPGPISLVKNDDDSHRLEYTNMPTTLSGTATRSFLAGVIDDLDLVVSPVASDTAECGDLPSGSLDLAPLIDRFGPFVRPILDGATP